MLYAVYVRNFSISIPLSWIGVYRAFCV
jgi:hypothetical protein